jgi:hypothetical protein
MSKKFTGTQLKKLRMFQFSKNFSVLAMVMINVPQDHHK